MSNTQTKPSSNPITSEFLTLHEIVKKARQRLSLDSWEYIVGGSETETTVRRNRAALDALAFKPRVLRDVSKIDTSVKFLGRSLRLPVMLAPVGSLELFSAGGAVDVVKAADQFNIPHMLSSVSLIGLEQLAQECPEAQRLYQLYVHGGPDWVDDLAARAMAVGCEAFCLTVDSSYYSRRERDIIKRNIRRSKVPGREFQATITWADVDRLKSNLNIPLILKGIATAEDAKLAVEHGVDIVYVSNHGGRQLDHDRGSMAVLPEVVDAVKGKAQIIVDGGFNRGTDVVKALAMGADLVGLGRMQCYGLAADGQRGVYRMLELLETEVKIAMGLIGVTAIDELNQSHLCWADRVSDCDVLGAFPHLETEDKSFY